MNEWTNEVSGISDGQQAPLHDFQVGCQQLPYTELGKILRTKWEVSSKCASPRLCALHLPFPLPGIHPISIWWTFSHPSMPNPIIGSSVTLSSDFSGRLKSFPSLCLQASYKCLYYSSITGHRITDRRACSTTDLWALCKQEISWAPFVNTLSLKPSRLCCFTFTVLISALPHLFYSNWVKGSCMGEELRCVFITPKSRARQWWELCLICLACYYASFNTRLLPEPSPDLGRTCTRPAQQVRTSEEPTTELCTVDPWTAQG